MYSSNSNSKSRSYSLRPQCVLKAITCKFESEIKESPEERIKRIYESNDYIEVFFSKLKYDNKSNTDQIYNKRNDWDDNRQDNEEEYIPANPYFYYVCDTDNDNFILCEKK
jgi:hypothetical protein